MCVSTVCMWVGARCVCLLCACEWVHDVCVYCVHVGGCTMCVSTVCMWPQHVEEMFYNKVVCMPTNLHLI